MWISTRCNRPAIDLRLPLNLPCNLFRSGPTGARTHWASESHKCLLLFGLSQAGTPARERLGQARSLTQAKVEHRDRDTVLTY